MIKNNSKKKRIKKYLIITLILLLIGLVGFIGYWQYIEIRTIEMMANKETLIKKQCKILALEPRKYVSVIYSELYNNYNYLDDFDSIRVELGFNPSLGFGQMRISTLKWILKNTPDFENYDTQRANLISLLLNDTTNIYFSAFYIKLISDKYNLKYGNNSPVGILGSYYSLGIDHSNATISKSYLNVIGKTATEFYYSDKLIDIFPPQEVNEKD